MENCEDSFEVYKSCLSNQLKDTKINCEFLLKGHEICLKKTSFSDETKKILENLKINPKTPTKKICCVCPETKKARDDCHITGDETKCQKFYDSHKLCLLSEGFKIDL
jgi:cytochrome c oxidase assembly protein subunit 17